MSFGEIRFRFDRFAKEFAGAQMVVPGDLMEVPHAAENQIPSGQTLRRLPPGAQGLGLQHFRLDRADHAVDDLVLHGEQVGKVPVVSLGPHVVAGLGLDQLRAHADPVPGLPRAPLQ